MTDWMIWLALAGVLVAIEISTGTFYLLMIAISCATGGITALTGAHFSLQFIIAGIVGIFVIILLRKRKSGFSQQINPQRDPAVNLDIGQTVKVVRWNYSQDGINRTRVNYRGALWNVELLPGSKSDAGYFIIREMRGATLLVDNDHE